MQRPRISVRKFLGALAAAAVLYFGLGALLHYVVFPEEAARVGLRAKWLLLRDHRREVSAHPRPIETAGNSPKPISTSYLVDMPAAHTSIPIRKSASKFSPLAHRTRRRRGEVVSAGETLVVPPGTPHQPFNRGDVEMRSIARITPAGSPRAVLRPVEWLRVQAPLPSDDALRAGLRHIPRNSSAGGRAGDVLPSGANGTASRIPQLLPGVCKAVSRLPLNKALQLTSASRVSWYRRSGSLRSPAALAVWLRNSVVYPRGQRARS